MTKQQARASVERQRKELDRTIISIKRRIDSTYLDALRRYAAGWGLEGNSPEYARLDAQLRQKYQKELTQAVEQAQEEFQAKATATFAEMTQGLPSRQGTVGEFSQAHKKDLSLSVAKKNAIERSTAMFSAEMKLLSRLQQDPKIRAAIGPVQGGRLSRRQADQLMKLLDDPQAAGSVGVDLHRWRSDVYGRDAKVNSSSMLGDEIERAVVADNYAMQNEMAQDVPEIKGYRVEVSPKNTRGGARKPDICDQMADDYPKTFVFKGWHYNCRCTCRPLIDIALLTPELAARGFIGVPSGREIGMPAGKSEKLNKSLGKYRNAFPEIVKANYVDYRGQTRLLADMQPDEALGYYFEKFGQGNESFLQGSKGLEVKLTAPPDPEVFMDTRLDGDKYRFNVSTLTAADGHNPAQDLLGAFKASGTGVPLSRAQLSAASDITHEMVHTMGRDYSFSQLEKMYPQWRDELLDFTINPDSKPRQTLEMLTEWYAREIFPDVAKKQGWTLPKDYRSAIGTGYVNMVDNFNVLLKYVPDPEGFKNRLTDILSRGDKALAHRLLENIIKENNILKNPRSATPLVNKMLATQDKGEFERYMEKTAKNPPVQQVSSAAKTVAQASITAAAGASAGQIAQMMELEKKLSGIGINNVSGTVKQLGTGLEGLKKDAIFDARISSMLRGVSYLARGIAITAPISIAADRYERTQKQATPPAPGKAFPNYRRHLNPDLYAGDKYAFGLACGVTDGMIELVDIPVNMLKNTVKYVGSGLLTLIGKAIPTPSGTVGSEAAKYFSGVNASADGMGSELLEFFVEYNTNPLFKKMFTDQVEAELKDYFRRLGGTGGEQGYAQGRLVVDVVSILASVGALKKLMGSWKRLKTFRLKDYLPAKKPALPPSAKGLPKKTPDIASLVDREAMDRLVNDPSEKLAANMTDEEMREYQEKKKQSTASKIANKVINILAKWNRVKSKYDDLKDKYDNVKEDVSDKIDELKSDIGDLKDDISLTFKAGDLTEEEKQRIFKEDEMKTIIILMNEFMTGSGAEKRVFTESDKITQGVKNSNMTRIALRKFYDGYMSYKRGERPAMPPSYRVDFSPFPSQGDTGPLNEWLKDGGYSTPQFLGTAKYYFDYNEKAEILTVTVEDSKTAYSLMFHLGGKGGRYGRDKHKALGETKQEYKFSLSLYQIRKILHEKDY